MPYEPCEVCAYCREDMGCPYPLYYQARCASCGRFVSVNADFYCGRYKCYRRLNND